MCIYIADNRKYATTGNNFNWLIFWGWKARRGELCQALFNTEGLILRLPLPTLLPPPSQLLFTPPPPPPCLEPLGKIRSEGANELVVRAQQLDSVAQLVRALHWNRRAADSIPARDLKLYVSQLFWLSLINVYKFPLDNFHLQNPSF